MKLPISMWSGMFNDLSPEGMVEQFRNCNYTHCEFSNEHGDVLMARGGSVEKIGAQFGQFAREKGLIIEQGHLPLKLDFCSDEAVPMLKKWLDLYQAIGIKHCVLHASGGNELPQEEQHAIRIKALTELSSYLEGTDLCLCLENLGANPACYTSHGLMRMIDDVGDDTHLAICLDTGHLHKVVGRGDAQQEQDEFIRHVGKRLKALHINTNNGLLDDHLAPCTGKKGVDFKAVMRGLDEVGYHYSFNMELPGEWRCPIEIRRIKMEYYQKLCSCIMDESFYKN